MSRLAQLSRPGAEEALTGALARWLPRQRWFGGKAREIAVVTVHDHVLLAGEVDVLDVLVDVRFADGHDERYQIPLCQAPAGTDGRWMLPGSELADATAVSAACRTLATAAASATMHVSVNGAAVRGQAMASSDVEINAPRRLTAEQSNTSVVFGDRHILKLFRRVEEGVNPDVEVTGALTAAGFPYVPAQRGALVLQGEDETALAVLSDFVAGGREGWDLAVDTVRALVDGAPEGVESWIGAVAELGRATAEGHAALREAFGAHEPAPGEPLAWAAAMQDQAERVLGTAERIAPAATEAVLARREELVGRLAAVAEIPWQLPLIRIHGDYHLGQVLRAPSGHWQLLDFEGEPVRSLRERRRHTAALRDVAGMLRSFDYAAAQGAGSGAAALPADAGAWRDESRRAFLQGYAGVAQPAGLLTGDDDWRRHLAVFELDKAVYELGYELANRPDWVPIPVGGILRVLEAP